MDLSKMRETQKELQNPQKSPKEFAVSKEIKGEVNNLFRIADSDKFSKCQRAWIVCDDGKPRPFTLVDNYGNRSPFLELLGDPDNFYRGGILESVKDPITKKGKFKYLEEYSELVTRFGYNGDRGGTKGNAKLQKQIVYQIYDRDLYEGTDEAGNTVKYYWCKENQHTMLMWLKVTAFETLIDVAEGNGDPKDYDCNYKKVGTGTSTTHVISRAGDLLPGVVIGPITDEEKGYAMYDLDSETAVSPAGLILYFLGKAIKDLDICLGKDVHSELERVATLERGEQSDSEETEGATKYEIEEEDESLATPSQPAVQSAPEVKIVVTPPAQPAAAPFVRGAAAAVAKEEVKTNTVFCQHPGCGKEIPADVDLCPSCKNIVRLACDNPECGKMVSVFAEKCPFCLQDYTS